MTERIKLFYMTDLVLFMQSFPDQKDISQRIIKK